MACSAPNDAGSSRRRILLTGGTGFIGSTLCRKLVGQGDHVTIVARRGSDRKRLLGISGDVAVVDADLTDMEAVADLVGRTEPDIVFHLASSVFNPPGLTAADHLEANVRSTLSLLESLKMRPDCRLIYTGSAAEYPPGGRLAEDLKPGPVNVYGAMKACASLLIDTYARIYGLRAARAVLFTVYGPGEARHRLVPSVIDSGLHSRNVHLSDGSIQRDMLFVDDAVEGLSLMAAADLAPGTVINLCSGKGLPIRYVAEEILRLMKVPAAIEERPQNVRRDEIKIVSGDNHRALELLGWQPQWSLEDGLRESIARYRAQEATAEICQ